MAEPQIVSQFAAPVAPISAEQQGFRAFKIDVAGYVEVPGVLEIEEIRLDGRTIPPYVDQSVPTDLTHKNFKTIRLPNYTLAEGPAGTPVILRSLSCNDGKWQVGSTVHVKGKFSDAKPADKK